MSTGTGTKTTAGAGLGRVLGVSSSQALVRVLLAVSSLALVALTSVAAPQGVVLGAVALFVLTVGTVWRPEAPAAGLLVIGLALHWLTAVPVPTSTASWLQLLVAAWLLLVVHLSAALAASLPPGCTRAGAQRAPLVPTRRRRGSGHGAAVGVGLRRESPGRSRRGLADVCRDRRPGDPHPGGLAVVQGSPPLRIPDRVRRSACACAWAPRPGARWSPGRCPARPPW